MKVRAASFFVPFRPDKTAVKKDLSDVNGNSIMS